MDRQSISEVRAGLHRAPRGRAWASSLAPLAALFFVVLFAGGCREVSLVEEDESTTSRDKSTIEAGRGVTLESIDGDPVGADLALVKWIPVKRVIVAPGEHEVRFSVRRDLEEVDFDLERIYRVGDCRVMIETPGGRGQVISSRIRKRLVSADETIEEAVRRTRESLELAIWVNDGVDGTGHQLNISECWTGFDCSEAGPRGRERWGDSLCD